MTDEELANHVTRSGAWRIWIRSQGTMQKGFRNWELPSVVRKILSELTWLADKKEEFEQIVQRVAKIIRSRNAKKAAATKKRKATAKKREKLEQHRRDLKAAQLSLL